MTIEQYANNASTTLNGNITTTPASGTSETWTVTSTAGNFPQIGQFRIIVDSEICTVTVVLNGTQWTVLRGQEGTATATHSSGSVVAHVLTRDGLKTILPNRLVNNESNPNLIFNSSGQLGTLQGWTQVFGAGSWAPYTIGTGIQAYPSIHCTDSNVENAQLRGQYIPTTAGITFGISCLGYISTGTSQHLILSAYNSSKTLLANIIDVSITTTGLFQTLSGTGVTPTNTAYIALTLQCSGGASVSYHWTRIKAEILSGSSLAVNNAITQYSIEGDLVAQSTPYSAIYTTASPAQSIVANTATAITFDHVTSDIYGMASLLSQPTRLMIPQGLSGTWQFGASFVFVENTSNTQYVFWLKKNNITNIAAWVREFTGTGINITESVLSPPMALSEGDYIELYTQWTVAGAMSPGSAINTNMWALRLGI